jgi:hypothetical protein
VSTKRTQFAALLRLLHWTMAAMILTMLCIGVAMVASLANYHVLVSIHRPLGIAILILVVVRFVNRQLTSLPPFPATMSRAERLAATASEFISTFIRDADPSGQASEMARCQLSKDVKHFLREVPLRANSGNWPTVAKLSGKTACFGVLARLVARRVCARAGVRNQESGIRSPKVTAADS